jgi:ribosome-associated protein
MPPENRSLTPISVPAAEIELTPIRAQGAGGQNVNKVATAIHLRFDVRASSLPDAVKQSVLALRDRRISEDGVVVIKSQRHRTQEGNRDEALARLHELIDRALVRRKPRKATKPTRASKERRLQSKKKASSGKALRARVNACDY